MPIFQPFSTFQDKKIPQSGRICSKKYQNCVLVFIKDSNLKSVTQTLKDYKNKDFYKKGNDKLIRNYGIGAQIIKDLKIKNMILITKSPKKVIGLDGYGIKITKQELI